MMATSVAALRTSLAEEYTRLYPGEAAAVLEEQSPDDLVGLVERSAIAGIAPVFAAFTPAAAARLLPLLRLERAVALLQAIDPARAASLCAMLDPALRDDLLATLPEADAREWRELMSYPANTAGGLMTVRVETFRPDTPAETIISRLRARRAASEGGPDGEVALVDAGGHLAGMVEVAALAAADPAAPAAQLARHGSVGVPAVTPREEVVDLMKHTGAGALPVVDATGRLLGIVRHRQLARAIEAGATAGLQTMVGAGGEEQALSPVGLAVRKRLPWLQINLATAFLAASVVGLFEATIAQVTALAVLLPVVAGQSGNAGSQALAVTIRGLALREVRVRHWRAVAMKEGAVGLINSLAVAATTSLGVYVWSRSLGLAAVIALSMVASMVVAGLAGAVIPMVLSAMRQDPAQSSNIILTTVTDVVGFFSFLGIATLLMSML
ncbi:MAG: CBS domain-containing protein [Acidobacteria bacterium]|nr:CBS domain-containing protein [Acidobacteriota bacterium]